MTNIPVADTGKSVGKWLTVLMCVGWIAFVTHSCSKDLGVASPHPWERAEFRNLYRESRYLLDYSLICELPPQNKGLALPRDIQDLFQKLRLNAKHLGFKEDSVAVDYDIMVDTNLNKVNSTGSEEARFRCAKLAAAASQYRRTAVTAIHQTERFLDR